MQIDELPAGEQPQNPDLDMNQEVGTRGRMGKKTCAGKFYLPVSFCYLCRISAFSGGTSFATQP